jgi:dolichol-phosphate mannosyltransferase
MKISVDSDCYVSVVAPLYEDSDIVESFVAELLESLRSRFENFEVVLVDDGSSDDTVARVLRLLEVQQRIRLIRLSRHFGQETAISAGLDSVIGDFVVVMLPDSDPPELVPEMVEKARSGFEMVYGIRRSRGSDPLFLRVGASAFYWYCNRILRLNLPKNSTHFRVMSRRVVNALVQIRDRGRYLRTLTQHVGYRTVAFPYDLAERRGVPRKKSAVAAVDLAVNIIASNSVRPLRMASWLSVLAAGANAAYALYLGLRFFLGVLWEDGYFSGSLPSSLAFTFSFLVLAVLCEYVGRLVDESKGRPLYYVMEEKNSSAPLLQERQRNVVTESNET